MRDKFVTVINCMDGRVQEQVNQYLISEYKAKYVDVITEAGPNKILAEDENRILIESIKNRVVISVQKHKSKIIAIVGHYDCAGNPVGEEIQKEQIVSAMERMKEWNLPVTIIGLWVSRNWSVEKIKQEGYLL